MDGQKNAMKQYILCSPRIKKCPETMALWEKSMCQEVPQKPYLHNTNNKHGLWNIIKFA